MLHWKNLERTAEAVDLMLEVPLEIVTGLLAPNDRKLTSCIKQRKEFIGSQSWKVPDWI